MRFGSCFEDQAIALISGGHAGDTCGRRITVKFLHTSDLHIGKIVNGFSMLEEQIHVLDQIVKTAVSRDVDAVFLCGDLYDRSVPPAQAVSVLDEFLTRLVEHGVKVFAIAGNHDSGERIGFAGRILEKKGLYMEGILENPVRFVDMETQGMTARIHMAPYAKPAGVRAVYGGGGDSYEECMKTILSSVCYLEDGPNILLTHQFVVNRGREPELSDSETRVSVGGADCVEAGNFKRFDYTALGHIHGRQQAGDGPVWYSGSPVKYSFSETYHEKAVIYGEIGKDGSLKLEAIPLTPVHDMRKIKGRLSDLIAPDVVESADAEDYILAVLTNEEELIDPIGTLRSVYPNVMQLQIERMTRKEETGPARTGNLKEKSPYELFEDFFLEVTGKELGEEQSKAAADAVKTAMETGRGEME